VTLMQKQSKAEGQDGRRRSRPTAGPKGHGAGRRMSTTKELARQFRHEAYLRSKEFRKTDPRQIAIKEQQKEYQREAYQLAKERNKAYRDEKKNAAKEQSARKKIVSHDKLLRKMLVPAGSIKGQETRVTREHAALVKARKATVADIARLTGVSKQAVAQMLKKYAEENEKAKNR